MPADLIIKNAELLNGSSSDDLNNSSSNVGKLVDIYICKDIIQNITSVENDEASNWKAKEVLDIEGAGLIPSLCDHHIHLLALLESTKSLNLSLVKTTEQFKKVIKDTAIQNGAVRGVGYHESIAGALTSQRLDELVSDKPVRIQHRTGALWILNSVALQELNISAPDGCLLRGDDLLKKKLTLSHFEGLGQVFSQLNKYGVFSFTDATPGYGKAEAEFFKKAIIEHEAEDIFCELTLMTDEFVVPNGKISFGPRKILLDDFALPTFSDLVELISATHKQNRNVAIHSVTDTSLAFCVAVFSDTGVRKGDRIEHASLASLDLVSALAELGVCVVTQPNFILERGDTYLKEVADVNSLYRCQGWLDAGVLLAGGTDAPFGDPNPWQAIWAAMNRKTRAGKSINPKEALSFNDALNLFLSSPDDPGGKPKEVKTGEVANLCILSSPLAELSKSQPANPVSGCLYKGVNLKL